MRVLLLATLAALLCTALAVFARWLWRHRARGVQLADGAYRRLAASHRVQRIIARHPELARRVRALFATHGYLLLYLAVGLVASVLALGAFTELAGEVRAHGAFVRFEERMLRSIHAEASPLGVTVFRVLTVFGGGIWLTAFALVVTVLLVRARLRLLAAAWAGSQLGTLVLVYALKAGFRRPRPVFADPFLVVSSWSFPSGHSIASLVAYGMLAYVGMYRVRAGRARVGLVVGAVLLTLLIGFSRVYLGVHYVTDVLAGFCVGGIWLTLCVLGAELARSITVARGRAGGGEQRVNL